MRRWGSTRVQQTAACTFTYTKWASEKKMRCQATHTMWRFCENDCDFLLLVSALFGFTQPKPSTAPNENKQFTYVITTITTQIRMNYDDCERGDGRTNRRTNGKSPPKILPTNRNTMNAGRGEWWEISKSLCRTLFLVPSMSHPLSPSLYPYIRITCLNVEKLLVPTCKQCQALSPLPR